MCCVQVKGYPLQQPGSCSSPLQPIPPGHLPQQQQQQPPLQPLQNVIYPQQVSVRPLHHQHSHDLLLGSPGRRGTALHTDSSDVRMGAPQQLQRAGPAPGAALTELDCTETDVQSVHVSNTYKPRI